MSSAELTIEDIKSHLNENEKEQLLATNIPPKFLQGLQSRDIKIGDNLRLTVQGKITRCIFLTITNSLGILNQLIYFI